MAVGVLKLNNANLFLIERYKNCINKHTCLNTFPSLEALNWKLF